MNRSWLVAGLAVAACGGSVVNNKQENSEPTGIVAGRVLDASNGMPLPGVLVSTFVDSMPKTVSTDATGRYQLGPMPAGSYTVFAEAPMFVKRIFTGVNISGAAGNFPTANVIVTRDFDMAKGDATIDGQVVTSTTTPANGATVYVDLRGNNYDIIASTKTDMAGKFKFTGLPGAAAGVSISVSVAPFDENGDGIPEFNSNSRNYTLFPGFTATGAITISAIGVPVLSSNIADSDLAPNESMVMTFGTPLRLNQSTFTLTRNSIGYNVGLEVSLDSTGTIVTLKPAGGALVEGQNYSLSWNVRAVNTAQSSGSQSFVVRPTNTMAPGTVQNFRVTSPTMMAYDSSLSSVTLAWDTLNNAGGYRVYVKDTQMNPAYLMMQSFNATAINGSVSLSTSLFGSSAGSLSNGNRITLAMVATDRAGNEGPLASASTIEISDNTPPTVSSGSQQTGFGTANNTAGSTPVTINYRVTYSEAMAQNTSPTFSPGDSRVTSTFAWTSANVGLFTITVPPGANAAMASTVTLGKDTSNNTQAMSYSVTLN